jgi:glutamyl-tRNA synthetase
MFYFQDTVIYEPAAAQKFLKTNVLEAMQLLRRQLENLADFSEAELEAAFQTVMEKTGLKLGKIAQPVRVALTGRAASPGIFEITSILGRTSVLKRIDAAIRYIEAQGRQTT